MKNKILLWVGIGLGIVGLGLALAWVIWWSNPQTQPGSTTTRQLLVNGHTLTVIMADTGSKQQIGLSQTKELQPNQGMYFPMVAGQPVSFWMKDMTMSIDIIWIKQGVVVGIEHQVPAPEPTTADADLPSYRPAAQGVDAVLEIGAGRAKQLGIVVGSLVELQ